MNPRGAALAAMALLLYGPQSGLAEPGLPEPGIARLDQQQTPKPAASQPAPDIPAAVLARAVAPARPVLPVPGIGWDSRRFYACRRTSAPPVVDGRLDDPAWEKAPWTDEFTDIQGSLRPAPRFRTRVKMLWDDTYFYIASSMEEPDLWATYTERDAVIYHENDFEVFIDPDGDTHEYYELELNALNTVWDLLLLKPYRDGGPAINAWDIAGLKTATHLDGTLNDPRDRDAGWSVEIAMPWKVLAECAHRTTPPGPGDDWRVNFSRVEWTRDPVSGGYVKRKDPQTGKELPEDNWVWSPQGLIAMHVPEMWGTVRFTAGDEAPGSEEPHDPDETGAAWLRNVYYFEKDRAERGEPFAADSAPVYRAGSSSTPAPPRIEIRTTASGFEATTAAADGGLLHIREDGRSWKTAAPRDSR